MLHYAADAGRTHLNCADDSYASNVFNEGLHCRANSVQ